MGHLEQHLSGRDANEPGELLVLAAALMKL